MNLPVTQKHFLSFSRKLFLSVISLFLVFAICFIAYQYQREREYKIELLNTKLQDYNSRLYEQLENQPLDSEIIDGYINNHILEDLRVTLIDAQGNVVYDSYPRHNNQMENHLNRPEVQKAIKHGNGYDVRRTSETDVYKRQVILPSMVVEVDLSSKSSQATKSDRNCLLYTSNSLPFRMFVNISGYKRAKRYQA